MGTNDGLASHVETPASVALIGTGVYGAHLVYQLEQAPAMTPIVLADIEAAKAKQTFRRAGVDPESVIVTDDPQELADAITANKRVVTTDGTVAAQAPIDVVVEATGDPSAAARHAWTAIDAENDIVMVSVEADVTVGPLLSRYASNRGVNYSMAYGDEPAQVVELVKWARLSGFDVVAAGQGTELTLDPHGTHEDSLERYGVSEAFIEENDPSPAMYNTFLDGTKIAVELCAAANALGLRPDIGGPHMPHTDREGLLEALRPTASGGSLERTGVIDAVTPTDYRNPSAFVVTRAENEAIQRYLDQRYNVLTANEGEYQLFDVQHHLPPETLVSIARVAFHDQVTGVIRNQTSEVIARAKRDLSPGDTLATGEDTIYGVLEAADVADEAGYVPYELLAGAEVQSSIDQDDAITEDDVALETDSVLYHMRQLQDNLV